MTNDEFYAHLLEWRNGVALKVNKIPPQILHNRTLREVADTRPQDRKAFKKIIGIGPCKIKDYADTILGMVAKAGSGSQMVVFTGLEAKIARCFKEKLPEGYTAQWIHLPPIIVKKAPTAIKELYSVAPPWIVDKCGEEILSILNEHGDKNV